MLRRGGCDPPYCAIGLSMMPAQAFEIGYARGTGLPPRRQSRELPMILVNTERARTPRHSADSSRSFPMAMPMTMTMGIIGILVSALLPSTLAASEADVPAAQYSKHLTCAVYYRMVAGSFKRQGNGILAAPALNRMNLMITDRKSTRLNSSHITRSRMPSSA